MANGTGTIKSWNVMQAFVAVTVLFGFFGIIFGWMVFPPKTSDAGTLAILNQLTGAVTTLAVAVVTYYVGSSKGSSDKDDAMAASMKTSTEAVSALATSGTGSGTIGPKTTTILNQPNVVTDDAPLDQKKP